MVPVMSLWAPILLAAVLVFVASSLIHMLLRYHNRDFKKVPSEDAVMEALRRFDIPPGHYIMPYCASSQEMKSPEYIEKRNKGPFAFLHVMTMGSMGASLAKWFVYCVVVGIFAAYITGRALGPGAEYLAVFRFAGCTAFIGYTLALWQNAIWYRSGLGATIKYTFDGLVFGLLTAGAFGWLWPNG